MTITVQVSPRATTSSKKLRASGKLPAVVYGPKQPATAIELDAREFEKAFKTAGESTILTLAGLSAPIDVLVHDIAFDPAKGGAMHVDFYAIEAGKDLTTNVPIHFVGIAPAEKLGGIIMKVLHEVEVTCRPSDLPSHIDVDLSVLTGMESHISIGDLVIPSGVTIENAADEIVATVSEASEEVEVPATVDMAAIEVEKKGKQETEEK